MRSASNRINEAEALRAYPKVLAALGAGLVSMAGVRAFLREVTGLDLTQGREVAAAVETHVLNRVGEPFLPELGTWTAEAIGELPFADVAALMGAATPGQLGVWARRGVALADGDAVRRGAEKTAAESMVELSPGGAFGMSWLGAWLPDAQAAAGWDRIDDLAMRRVGDGQVDPGPYGDHAPLDGEALSLDAVRAQVFFDLLMTNPAALLGDGAQRAPVPVNLTVLIDADGVASTPTLGPVGVATVEGLQAIAARTGGTVRSVLQEPVTCPGEHPNGGPRRPLPGPRRDAALRPA